MTKNDPSDEDKHLFRKMMRSVTPLNEKPNNKSRSEAKFKPKQNQPLPLPPELTYLSDQYYEQVHSDTVLTYCCSTFSANRFRELKNGAIFWENRLDLHGLRIDEARDTLCHFIYQQIQYKHRCALIIHGKGGRHREPLLKNLVNHWLKQIPQVLAFHSAINKHGGTGALYVFLKR